MKRVLPVVVGLVVAGGVGFVLMRTQTPPTQATEVQGEAGKSMASKPSTRRSILPKNQPAGNSGEAEPTAGGEDSKAEQGPKGGVSSVLADPKATALVGLEVKAMDDGLREKLKVPNNSQIGYGVVIQHIHPDSPAAEVFMKPNDVIVRAALKKVDSVEDLRRLVGDRDHTMVTVSRDGNLVQMVLKQPYRRK